MSLAVLHPLQFRHKEESPAAFLARATSTPTYAQAEPDSTTRYLRGVAAGYHDAPGTRTEGPRAR